VVWNLGWDGSGAIRKRKWLHLEQISLFGMCRIAKKETIASMELSGASFKNACASETASGPFMAEFRLGLGR